MFTVEQGKCKTILVYLMHPISPEHILESLQTNLLDDDIV